MTEYNKNRIQIYTLESHLLEYNKSYKYLTICNITWSKISQVFHLCYDEQLHLYYL